MSSLSFFFFFNDTATTEIYTLSLHDALPISSGVAVEAVPLPGTGLPGAGRPDDARIIGEFVGPPIDFIKIMQDLFPQRDLSRYDRTLIALRQDGWKIQWGSDGRHTLYHVAEDPGETIDLAASEPERLKEMTRRVQDWLRRPPPPPAPPPRNGTPQPQPPP